MNRTWHFTRRAHRLATGVMMAAGLIFGLVWPYVLVKG
jgi:tetrahydromethanopterin S-methyltransferase subunit F